jgi:hypothetical protein
MALYNPSDQEIMSEFLKACESAERLPENLPLPDCFEYDILDDGFDDNFEFIDTMFPMEDLDSYTVPERQTDSPDTQTDSMSEGNAESRRDTLNDFGDDEQSANGCIDIATSTSETAYCRCCSEMSTLKQ